MSETSAQDTKKHLLSPRRSIRLLFIFCVLVYVFLVAVPLVQGVPTWMAVYGSSLLLAAFSMLLVYAGASLRISVGLEVGLAVASLLLWIALLQVGRVSETAGFYAGQGSYVAFLLLCLFVGRLLGRIVREKSIILPVCIVAGLVDIFTVFWGPTGRALKVAPDLVERFSLSVPQAGSAAGPEGVEGLTHIASIGVGDFIFLALFLSVAVRFGLPVVRSLIGIAIATFVGMTVTLLNPVGLIGLPMLPFMAVGFIAANARQFELSAGEWRDLLIALTVVLVILIAAIVALHY